MLLLLNGCIVCRTPLFTATLFSPHIESATGFRLFHAVSQISDIDTPIDLHGAPISSLLRCVSESRLKVGHFARADRDRGTCIGQLGFPLDLVIGTLGSSLPHNVDLGLE